MFHAQLSGPGMRSTGRHFLLVATFFALLVLSGCSASVAKQEYSYITAPEAVLRDRVAAVYEKTGVLHNGERVAVLERMTTRRFVRVRSSRGEEGWIQERYLTDQQTFDEFQRLLQQFKNTPAQAVAETKAQVNLHVSPGRKTEHLYQLNEKEKVDLLVRKTADKNASAPKPNLPSQPKAESSKAENKEAEPEPSGEDSTPPAKPGAQPALEDWWLVRDTHNRVGWVLGRMLYVDVPIDIAQYAEGRRIVGFYVLDQVQDEDKSIPEYLVLLSEGKDGMPYDYDQIRVYTWNRRRHRYETAYRGSGLSGFLPVTMGKESFGKEGDLSTFTVQLADANGALHQQKYKFNPPIVRAVLAEGETIPKAHHKAASPRHSR
jgi:hypothetical protein